MPDNMEDKAILKYIKRNYTGEELEMHLQAWADTPTLKKDCTIKRLEKAAIRSKFVKQLKALRHS